jgi:Lrp/AsnC family transcriptional regulator
MAIRTTEHNADWLDSFHKAVRSIPEIVGAYRTSGDTDYILHARIPDVHAYDQLYQKLIERVALSDVSGSFVMEELKQVTELPLTFL